MSPALATVSATKAIKALETLGYQVVRQRGSHIRLRHASDAHRKPLTIPNHGELKIGLLRGLLRTADVSVEEFLQALGGK